MKAININDKEIEYTRLMFRTHNAKDIETRATPSLMSVVGQRVGIIRTGKGPAMLVGYVDVVGVKVYENREAFQADYARHFVPKGSKYDIKSGGKKYGFILANAMPCDPTPVTSKGIVIRNI